MDLIKGNCGLVFTKNDICETRKQLIKTKKQSSAKVGSIAPTDIFLPIGPTNLQPTQTLMFQITPSFSASVSNNEKIEMQRIVIWYWNKVITPKHNIFMISNHQSIE